MDQNQRSSPIEKTGTEEDAGKENPAVSNMIKDIVTVVTGMSFALLSISVC